MKKHVVIIVSVFVILLIIGAGYLINKDKPQNQGLIYEVLDKRGQNFKINEKDNIVVDKRTNQEESAFDGRGYLLMENNGDYYLTICYGWIGSGYSSFNVKKVEINGKNVKVIVKEPKRDTTQAFTYPTVTIKFNKKPEKIEVVYK